MLRPAVLAASFATCLAAQPTAALERLCNDPALSGARVGVCVRSLEDGSVALRHDDDRGFMTASNMKLITAAVALRTLGPEFRFRTRLHARGRIAGEVLDGDLVLVGSGDPTLGGRHERGGPTAPFDNLAGELRDRLGVRLVTGGVFGDDDCHADEVMGSGWAWGYESEDYAAQLSGLCFAENFVRLEFPSTPEGLRPGMRVVPETSYLSFAVQVATGGERTALDVQRARGGNRVTVRGALAADKRASATVTVENPTAFAAHVLRERLLAAGVLVRGPAADLDDRAAPLAEACVEVATIESPPLREILVTLNKTSQNLYAEQLIRAAAAAAMDKADMRSAEAHAKQVLRELGVEVAGMAIADGSGLSRLNLVQPAQLAALLVAMWREPERELFVASLPVAGVDGTLQARFGDSPAKGRVRAKTGFISRVVCLSGYAPPLAFSVMLNNFTCPPDAAKAAVDAFVSSLPTK